MKKLKALLGLLIVLVMPWPANAQSTKAALTTEINTNLASGQSGGITALQLRTTLLDTINSIMPTAPVGAGNLACFSGTTGLLQDCGTLPGTGVLTALGVNVGTAGAFVVNGGALGTPSSATLTNATGLPIGTGVSGLGTNVATWLATPSSANLFSALTTKTGNTSSVVFADSPTFTGTPAAPTAAPGTNTTQLATTAVVVAERSATKTLTNTTIDTAGTGNHIQISGTDITRGQILGEASTGNASAGNIGEYAETVVASGSAVSLSTGASKDITTLTLAAGDWDVSASCSYILASTTSITNAACSVSQTLNTLDTTNGRQTTISFSANVPTAGTDYAIGTIPLRFSLSGSTTFHMVAQATFTVSTTTGYGIIRARRAR